jgi:tetratricopeptide (TPR) repeat protein
MTGETRHARRSWTCAVALAVALSAGCSATSPPASEPDRAEVPPARAIPSDAEATERTIRILEARAKADPDDFIARNKLAGYYLQRLRETGSLEYLTLAGRAARESLVSVPADQNTGGLAALAQVEFASHDFRAAAEHARELSSYEPNRLAPRLLLADCQLELGDYEAAASTYAEASRRDDGSASTAINLETRLARLDMLRGDAAAAERRLASALEAALTVEPPPRETVAWCYWQLGEAAFSTGRYAEAERHYGEALTAFPGYYRALASLGRALAARDDLDGAIAHYEQAVRVLPDPEFAGALGDLYTLAGREADARAQYDLVAGIARLSTPEGALYGRQLALFFADHDLEPEAAYRSAAAEYQTRRDVYGADALAWTALKAGRVDEAAAASRDALRLGTRDAKLLYHAGIIARAAGDAGGARRLLSDALALNPRFDPLQARRAREALDALGGPIR